MKLTEINTHIRQRTPWEAVDLGFAIVQQHWRSIYPAWILFALLCAAVSWLILPENYKFLSIVIFWWMKPLYDRLLLNTFSHQLFSHTLSTREQFAALPALIRNSGLFSALTWRRFSLSRAYNLPIWQLEGLRGDAKNQRQDVIYTQNHGHAIWLTLGCRTLELILFLSLYALLLLFDPGEYVWEFTVNMMQGHIDDESLVIYWLTLFVHISYTLIVIVLEPFFVAAGFSLYLNRRTQLEAWDIEIAFRSLGERLATLKDPQKTPQSSPQTKTKTKTNQTTSSLVIALALLTALLMATPPSVQADSVLAAERLPVSQIEAQLEATMDDDNLSRRKKIQRWVSLKDDEEDTSEDFEISEAFTQIMAEIMRFILWIAAAILLVWVFINRERILALLKPKTAHSETLAPPDILFGMDIRPESLPDDIPGAAQTLWEQQQHRESLSLLYRGALMWLTRHDQVAIQASHTEGDILQEAQPNLVQERQDYLQNLTRHWQTIAYAHRQPDDESVQNLFKHWHTAFTIKATKPEPDNANDDTPAGGSA